MNIFQQFLEFMNAGDLNTNAEQQIDEHEDKEAAFARELAALLEKYGLELQDEEEENHEEGFANETDEEKAKADVAKAEKEKEKAKTEKQKGDADEKIEEAELKENKDEKKEYNNSGDFEYFKGKYEATKKAAPSTAFFSIEDQRKLGKEIF